MSIQEITATFYRCTCDLADCQGRGQSWTAMKIPRRCKWCRRDSLEGRKRKGRPPMLPTPLRQMTPEERRKYNREAQIEFRKRKKETAVSVQPSAASKTN